MPEPLVIDASALVDMFTDAPCGIEVSRRVAGHELHAPAHLDAEVLSALGRMQRAGWVEEESVGRHLRRTASAPILRHPLARVLEAAWTMRHSLRLADALYVALAEQLGATLVTTDARLARASGVELVE